ncbi:MAG: EndoU domain-containing protein [Acidobacteriota bacterium]
MKRRTWTALAALAVAFVIYLGTERTGQAPSRRESSPPPPPAAQAPVPPPAQAPAPKTGAGVDLGDGEWSDTRPAINQEHIFEGQVNKRGKPVGFHSRPGGRNPSGARVVRIVQGPNRAGVYIADVEIRNASGRWLRKRSTFYPDRLSREEVVAAVLHAWNLREKGRTNPFHGPSGEGFEIEGRPLDGGDINTAYPLFDPGE